MLGLDRRNGVVERGYRNVVADNRDSGRQILVGDRIKEELDCNTRIEPRVRLLTALRILWQYDSRVKPNFLPSKLVELKVLIAASAKLLCVWRPC